MAIVPYSPESVTVYIGLHADTKPTSATPGSTFFETDTTNSFITDGAGNWYLLPAGSGGGGGGAVTIADGADVTQGAKADAAQQDPTQAATLVALFKGFMQLVGAASETPGDNTVLERLQVLENALVGTLAISAAALPLPTGASTAAAQATGNASLANLDVALSTRTKPADQQHAIIDSSALPAGAATQTTLAAILAALTSVPVTGTFWQATQPVSAASLPLPTGAATAANQTAALPAGTNLLGKVGIDQTTPGTTDSVTVATGQGAGATVGVTTGAAVTTDANGTLQQYLRGLVKLFTGALFDSTNALRVSLFGKNAANGDTAVAVEASGNVKNREQFQPVAEDNTNGVIAIAPKPVASATYAPTNISTTAYAASLVIKASAGVLFGLTGYNSKASAQFIQLHDAASLPADTAVPKVILTVPATSNFSVSFGSNGRYFGTGIVACSSSTGPTKTIGVGSDIWFDAQYV